MIKGLILDVDGVIVGYRKGFNTPDPHPDVIASLKAIRSKDIAISLCTAKPLSAIRTVISLAGLDNVHISDGGAVIVNPLSNEIHTHALSEETVIRVLSELLAHNLYTEIYSPEEYYIQKKEDFISDTHAFILKKEPILVSSLIDRARTLRVIKIMPIVRSETEMELLKSILIPFGSSVTFQSGIHPVALPWLFGIITAPGVSKSNGCREISTCTGVPLGNSLGVGDSKSDWEFIKICGYAGAMGNGQDPLKANVMNHPHGYIGGHVDENGILDIFRHFRLM